MGEAKRRRRAQQDEWPSDRAEWEQGVRDLTREAAGMICMTIVHFSDILSLLAAELAGDRRSAVVLSAISQAGAVPVLSEAARSTRRTRFVLHRPARHRPTDDGAGKRYLRGLRSSGQ